jgi:hypothetical protein
MARESQRRKNQERRVISKPFTQRVGVSNGCFLEAESNANLGTQTFGRRPAGNASPSSDSDFIRDERRTALSLAEKEFDISLDGQTHRLRPRRYSSLMGSNRKRWESISWILHLEGRHGDRSDVDGFRN